MKTTWFMILSLVMLFGCAEKEEEGAESSPSDQTPVISVSNYPLQYFVERLAPWANVRFSAKAAGDPAYWKPGAEDISAMQESDLIVLNGASYETWLANVSLSQAKLVDTAAGLTGSTL